MPNDVQLTVTRNYGETASDKVSELLLHLFIAIVVVTRICYAGDGLARRIGGVFIGTGNFCAYVVCRIIFCIIRSIA